MDLRREEAIKGINEKIARSNSRLAALSDREHVDREILDRTLRLKDQENSQVRDLQRQLISLLQDAARVTPQTQDSGIGSELFSQAQFIAPSSTFKAPDPANSARGRDSPSPLVQDTDWSSGTPSFPSPIHSSSSVSTGTQITVPQDNEDNEGKRETRSGNPLSISPVSSGDIHEEIPFRMKGAADTPIAPRTKQKGGRKRTPERGTTETDQEGDEGAVVSSERARGALADVTSTQNGRSKRSRVNYNEKAYFKSLGV